MKDQSLFGPVDEAVNAVELEISIVKDQIEKHEAAIERKERNLNELESRAEKLRGALSTLRKSAPKPKKAK